MELAWALAAMAWALAATEWVLVVMAWVLELDQEEKEARGAHNPLSLEVGNMRTLLLQMGKWIHRGNKSCLRNHRLFLDR